MVALVESPPCSIISRHLPNGTSICTLDGISNGYSNGTFANLPRKDTPGRGLTLTESLDNAVPVRKLGAKARSAVPDALLLPNGYPDYLRLILTSKVYEVVQETPLTHARNLSDRLGCNVLLKREDLQPIFSFKLRGAYNRMAHLHATERWKGVIACSAGNHGQGVAYAARKLKIPATIVMPSSTPDIKHKNVSRLGASVVLHGADFDAAKAEAARLEKAHGLVSIPPFDDPYIIAGQGTIGVEILRQTNLQNLEAIFCCIGGGGLIAGVGVYVKRIAPHIKIIGVETDHANAMKQSLQVGKRVMLQDVGLFADGKAVKTIGEENYRLCTEVIDDVIQVTTDETCAAIKDVFEDTRSILEPAGALALAGLKKYVAQHPSQSADRGMVAVASGANMNFDRLRFVAERAALGENKEALLSVIINEKPGAFAELVQDIYPLSVTEFSYRYQNGRDKRAHILLSVAMNAATRNRDLQALQSRLQSRGMEVADLSGDELVKSHLRYLGGGRSSIKDERLYSFEFPERPGALARFLSALQPGFNITLFHYRDYGSDVGKVLAGMQVPSGQEKGLDEFLKETKYAFKEETDNTTFKQFLLE